MQRYMPEALVANPLHPDPVPPYPPTAESTVSVPSSNQQEDATLWNPEDLLGGDPSGSLDDSQPHAVCSHDMEEFALTINNDDGLTLQLVQAPTAFRGVENDETGSVVWGASICLARFLTPALIRGRTLLELGCGCGVPSLVASKYGTATRVAATDFEDATLQHLDHLAQRNGCSDLELYKLNWKELDDPNHPLEQYQADIILASDVIYHHSMVPPLVNTIQRYLGAHGKAYLALRNTRQGVTEFWQHFMPEAGFELLDTISCQPYQNEGRDNESNNSNNNLPPGFQNDANSHRWRGDHTIYVFERKGHASKN